MCIRDRCASARTLHVALDASCAHARSPVQKRLHACICMRLRASICVRPTTRVHLNERACMRACARTLACMRLRACAC
eukprot:1027886-Alexandrium_andersonii.AAC.1